MPIPDENTHDPLRPASTVPPVTPTYGSPEADVESSKSHLKQATDDLRSAAETKARELRAAAEAKATELRGKAEAKASEFRGKAEVKATELRGKAEEAYGDARAKVQHLRQDGEHYVRQNPSQAVLAALGIGFVLGLIFRR